MWFDRRVSEALLAALEPGGVLAALVDLRNLRRDLLDLQFHRSRRGRRSRAVLHAGSSVVLIVDERSGHLRLRPGPGPSASRSTSASPSRMPKFRDRWRRWMDAAAVEQTWPEVASYLHRCLARTEGVEVAPVARLCGALVETHRIVARPAAVRLADEPVPSPAPAQADLLAVDGDGRVLVVAVAGTDPLRLAPQTARIQAELFALLFNGADRSALEALMGMADQRVRVRLDRGPAPVLGAPLTVVPVVAVGPDDRQPDQLTSLDAEVERLERLVAVPGLERLEVWLLDADGRPEVRYRGSATAPFAARAAEAGVAWRRTTTTIPEQARRPTPLAAGTGGDGDQLRLPLAHAGANLLPDARERALERFAAAGRRWPGGEAGGPSPHLLSASVQCANALAPLVEDPSGLATVLDGTVPVARVLPFGASMGMAGRYWRDDHVVFGWSSPQREPAGGVRAVTAADAAIRYETAAGDIEIALLAWVYAGDPGAAPGIVADPEPGCRHDPDGPLRTDLVADADLAVEPFATLAALQCMAWRMERAAELGARRVRVVLCAPAANRELADALAPVHRHLGGGPGALAHAPAVTVADAWRALLRRPDRFAFLDTARLVAPEAPTSVEFKRRYRDLAGEAPDRGSEVDREATEPHGWPVTRTSPVDRAAVERRLSDAAAVARVVARQALVDRDVLAGVAEGDQAELATLSTVELAELAARLEELAGLIHRLRFRPPPP